LAKLPTMAASAAAVIAVPTGDSLKISNQRAQVKRPAPDRAFLPQSFIALTISLSHLFLTWLTNDYQAVNLYFLAAIFCGLLEC